MKFVPGNTLIVVDEAYHEFTAAPELTTALKFLGRYPNLIVTRTFSKAYGLASLRLGLLAGPESQLRWTRRVLSPYSVNSLALACLPAALCLAVAPAFAASMAPVPIVT